MSIFAPQAVLTLCPPNFAMSRCVMVKLLYISDPLWRSNEALQSWGLPLSLVLQLYPRQEIVIELWAEPTFEASVGETAVHGP